MLLLSATRIPTPPSQALPAPMFTLRQKATFMDERGPGAFAPMPKLPRHKSQPPCAIHFSQDDSDSSDELGSSSNMLGLTVDTSNVLSNFPTGILRRGS